MRMSTSLTPACSSSKLFTGPLLSASQGFLALSFSVLFVAFVACVVKAIRLRSRGVHLYKTLTLAFVLAAAFCLCSLSRTAIYLWFDGMEYGALELILHRFGHAGVMLIGFLLVVPFSRLSYAPSKLQRALRILFFALGVIAVVGRTGVAIYEVFYENTALARYLSLSCELAFCAALLCVVHSSDKASSVLYVSRLKGVLAFFFLRSIIVLGVQIWIDETAGTSIRDSYLTFIIDFCPLAASLAATWSFMTGNRANRNSESPAWGMFLAYMNRKAGVVFFFMVFYVSIVLLFGWGAEATCFSPLSKLGWAGILARASAKPLLFLCPILLLSVLHGALGLLRRVSLNDVLPLEGNLNVHIHCSRELIHIYCCLISY